MVYGILMWLLDVWIVDGLMSESRTRIINLCMLASYMKHFAKFLAILHNNASFFNFCLIINFGFLCI